MSSLRKAGMKNLYPDFTQAEKVPKTPFSAGQGDEKIPGHFFTEMPGDLHSVKNISRWLRWGQC